MENKTTPDSRFDLLGRAVRATDKRDVETARNLLEKLLRELPPGRCDAEEIKLLVFASALTARVGGSCAARANLYLRHYERAQIDLFNLMASQVPLVSVAGAIANELLCETLRGRSRATLLDIGVGSGRQIVALLERMRELGIRPEALTVVGIEPAVETLGKAQAAIAAKAAETGVPLRFEALGKCVEQLDDSEWARLEAHDGDLIINEAFAAHHVRGKDALLARLRTLNPVAFVLSEPHSDHDTGDLESRFRNAWKHFGLAFDVIDRLAIDETVKGPIKMQFFAREIEDVLGSDEHQRSERHETAEMWLARLRRAGFTPREGLAPVGAVKPDVISVSEHGGYVGLDLGRETIVAIMCCAA